MPRRRAAGTRLKVCANPDCQRAFYDFAPGGVGKSCCLRCSDRIRARAYRKGERYQRFQRLRR